MLSVASAHVARVAYNQCTFETQGYSEAHRRPNILDSFNSTVLVKRILRDEGPELQ